MRLVAANFHPFNNLGDDTAAPSALSALCPRSGWISLSSHKQGNDEVNAIAAIQTTAKTARRARTAPLFRSIGRAVRIRNKETGEAAG